MEYKMLNGGVSCHKLRRRYTAGWLFRDAGIPGELFSMFFFRYLRFTILVCIAGLLSFRCYYSEVRSLEDGSKGLDGLDSLIFGGQFGIAVDTQVVSFCENYDNLDTPDIPYLTACIVFRIFIPGGGVITGVSTTPGSFALEWIIVEEMQYFSFCVLREISLNFPQHF